MKIIRAFALAALIPTLAQAQEAYERKINHTFCSVRGETVKGVLTLKLDQAATPEYTRIIRAQVVKREGDFQKLLEQQDEAGDDTEKLRGVMKTFQTLTDELSAEIRARTGQTFTFNFSNQSLEPTGTRCAPPGRAALRNLVNV